MLDSHLKMLLEQDHEFLQLLINAMPTPIFYKDVDGIYLGCNDAFEEFIAIRREDLIGHSVFDLYPQDDAELYHRKDKQLFDNPGTQVYEAEIHDIDGGTHVVQFHKSTFHNADGRVAGLVGVIFDITERKQLEERLERLASYDDLTGIYNRREALKRLEQAIRAARRNQRPLSVALLDIDFFKQVNDQYGHESGDQALVQVAEQLRLSCREYDVVARYGGEEFLLILPDTELQQARALAERLRLRMAHTSLQLPHGRQANVTISTGLAGYDRPDKLPDATPLLAAVDKALYRAKHLGRNRVELVDPEADTESPADSDN